MIQLIDLRNQAQLPELPRAAISIESVTDTVSEVLLDVKNNGDNAVIAWNKKFSRVDQAGLRVPKEVITQALSNCDPQLVSSLKEAIKRIHKFHQAQTRQATEVEVSPGGNVKIDWLPVARVGLYVPAGGAVYPSSVIMNVVPAQVAKVSSIAVVSPGQLDNNGWPHPTVLAACALLEIDEVYAAGGAQAVAMMAYGTESCPAVNLITGPGNIYVTAAKRLVRGLVAIDSEAGPTEIAILADASARADWVAADLISQAEHDVAAASILVTDSEELSNQVLAELKVQVADAKHSNRIASALSGIQSAIVLVKDLAQGLEVINKYAAEHLEIHTDDARTVAEKITNAGAVFIGPYAPVSLGDYLAGSNHVLPTGGCACHSSGLSVQTFLRGVQFIEYDKAALAEVQQHLHILAEAEDLPAHGKAVDIRFEN
jgi:histidinol dehydrogenase